MTWTYTTPDPTLDPPKDWVRFLIGDTNTASQLLSDEEIVAILSVQTRAVLAAALLADALAARFARLPSVQKIGQTTIENGRRAEAYRALAASLRSNIDALEGVTEVGTQGEMLVGGSNIAASDVLFGDTASTQPSFAIGQDDRGGPFGWLGGPRSYGE